MTTNPQKLAAPLTLVTAYFQIEDPFRNRATHDYHQWMANLLPFINWPVVVFCDAQSVDIMKRLRGDKPTTIYVTRREEFLVWRYREILQAHNAQRRPGFAIDLVLVYHEKANFVRRVIDENPYQSEMFLWCDAGGMRALSGEWKYQFLPRVMRFSDRIEWPSLQVCRGFGDKVTFFGIPNPAPPPPRENLSVLGLGRNLGRQSGADATVL